VGYVTDSTLLPDAKKMTSVDAGLQNSPVRRSRPDAFLLLLLVASLSLNVYLGWKVKRGGGEPDTAKAVAGMKVDPINAVDLDGKPFTIAYNGINKPTVFYVITPSCIWCRRNQANVNRLADAKANDFRFVGLSLDESGLKEYVEKHQLKFPVYARLPAETVESLGLGSTPQTIVVSPEGEIVKVWSGAYIEDLHSEVEAYFGIQLPGLVSAGK
jgi:peroxiredoxin